MATFNQCSFIGRLGKDPDLQVTGTGKPYTRFSLAVDQGKDQQPMWLNVTTWDKLAETVERYATKGMQVFVQGKLQLRSYTDKDKVNRQAIDIVAFTVQLLEKRQNGAATSAQTSSDDDPFLPDSPDE
jgi:single-strand DNA-binding protein